MLCPYVLWKLETQCSDYLSLATCQGPGTWYIMGLQAALLIRLQRIYIFLLFHAVILSFLDVLQSFIVILYHFLVLTYWHSANCQLLFFHVFYIAENQYQTESKWHETLWWFFMDQKEEVGPWLQPGGVPRRGQPTMERHEALAHPGGLCPPRVPPDRLFAL